MTSRSDAGADGFALARRILGDIGRLYDELDDDGLGAMSRSALAIAQTAEILASHEAKQPGAEQPGAGAISWAPAPNILGDRYIGGTVKTDAPTWDAEAIEATLRRAEAEGLRVRITWHPGDRNVTQLGCGWGDVEGVPLRHKGVGLWKLSDGGPGTYWFCIGEHQFDRPGIIAAEIIDEPAAEPTEPEPAKDDAPPWAAPTGWERDRETLRSVCEPVAPYADESSFGYTMLLVGSTAVEFDLVRDYIARKERVTDGEATIIPLNDCEAIIVDDDGDVAIVEDAVLRSQIAWLDREGGR